MLVVDLKVGKVHYYQMAAHNTGIQAIGAGRWSNRQQVINQRWLGQDLKARRQNKQCTFSRILSSGTGDRNAAAPTA